MNRASIVDRRCINGCLSPKEATDGPFDLSTHRGHSTERCRPCHGPKQTSPAGHREGHTVPGTGKKSTIERRVSLLFQQSVTTAVFITRRQAKLPLWGIIPDEPQQILGVVVQFRTPTRVCCLLAVVGEMQVCIHHHGAVTTKANHTLFQNEASKTTSEKKKEGPAL